MPQPEQPDLDLVVTPEDLAAALTALRLSAGFESKRSLTTAAGKHPDSDVDVLPKSTVDDALAGRRVPNEETLRGLLAVCGVTDEAAIAPWLQAAAAARRDDTDRPVNAVRSTQPTLGFSGSTRRSPSPAPSVTCRHTSTETLTPAPPVSVSR